MSNKPKVINTAIIKAWAKMNKEQAKQLGLRLFQNQANPENLRNLPSLGEFEDSATEWAIQNPNKAKMLIMGMLKDFMG